jgi:hypothetical protein
MSKSDETSVLVSQALEELTNQPAEPIKAEEIPAAKELLESINEEPTSLQLKRFGMRMGVFLGCVFVCFLIEFLRTCVETLSIHFHRPLAVVNTFCLTVAGLLIVWTVFTAEHQIRCENIILARLAETIKLRRARLEKKDETASNKTRGEVKW